MLQLAIRAAVSGPSVTVAPTKSIPNQRTVGTCHANVKVSSDGDLYDSDNTGSYGASYETWLDSGLNSEVWIQRVVISGSLSTDAGSGVLACTSDRVFGVSRATEGTKVCVIDTNFYSDSGGTILLDTQRVTLTAEQGLL